MDQTLTERVRLGFERLVTGMDRLGQILAAIDATNASIVASNAKLGTIITLLTNSSSATSEQLDTIIALLQGPPDVASFGVSFDLPTKQ